MEKPLWLSLIYFFILEIAIKSTKCKWIYKYQYAQEDRWTAITGLEGFTAFACLIAAFLVASV